MDKILLIIKREYWANVKKRSFLVMTLLAPFLIVLFLAVVIYIGKANDSKKKIAIIDESGLFQEKLKSTPDWEFSFFSPYKSGSLKDSVFRTKSLDVLIEIPAANDSLYTNLEKGVSLIVKNDLDINTQKSLTTVFRNIIENKRLKVLGISKQKLSYSKSNMSFNLLSLATNQKGGASAIKLSLASALAYIVFMFIMIYGVRVMRSVIEEKNSRVVEVIISSVKPIQLMIGKIIGTALTALTQFIIWIMLAFIFMGGYQAFETQKIGMQSFQHSMISDQVLRIVDILFSLNYPFIIATFLLFFTLGYLFFSSFFAAIGAAVDNETETQQFTLLAIMPLMIGGYGSFTSLMTNPNGNILALLSIFPMTSPVAMVIRSPYEVPVWQWLLAVFILLVSTIGMIYLAAKIYRTGILMYGKKASFKEIYRWLKY